MNNGILIVAQHALQEALRRRVLPVVLVLTVVFGGLYAWGCHALFNDLGGFGKPNTGLDPVALAGSTIVGLAMFGGLFLGVVLATFLTAGAVRGDAERGLLQPLVVRPLGRGQYLLGRFLATRDEQEGQRQGGKQPREPRVSGRCEARPRRL